MKYYWQEKNPNLFQTTQQEVEDKYSSLRFEVQSRIVVVSGMYPVADEKGVIERFQIEMLLPPRFPKALPSVWETGNRIPRTANDHMFPNGACCLFVEEDWWAAHPDGYRLIEFLDVPVRNFFLGQSMVLMGMPWPFGERSHGLNGILESYAQLTGAPSLALAEEYLRLLAKEKITGHHLCPCGSGKNLRHCHQKMLRELRERIPQVVARRTLRKVMTYRAPATPSVGKSSPVSSLLVRQSK